MKFLLKLIIFLAPVALVLGFPAFVLYHSQELMPDAVIVVQQTPATSTVLAGLAYTNPVDYLNLQLAIAKRPEILVLGSSRVGEFRSTFFTPTTTVYVASGLQKIAHFSHFLDDIPTSSQPKILIIGLDQKFFDPSYDSGAPDNIDTLLTQPTTFTDVAANWSTVYGDYFHKKFSLGQILDRPSSSIGLESIANGQGYRSDGSRDIGDAVYSVFQPGSADYHFESTLSLIDKGITGFEYSNAVSTSSLAELNAFLADCRARNITVIGFVPPFAPDIYQAMLAAPDHYGYLIPLHADLAAIFQKNGVPFYDFTDPSSIGITDTEMSDGLHTTEKGSLMMFISMAEQNPTLRQYTDLNFLRARLAEARPTTTQYNLF